ncbi:MAG: prenyltransferase [Methanobacterium sp.]|nr:prenyltransferase [Methanobacterium sp.]
MDYTVQTFVNIVKLGRPQYLAGNFLVFTMGALLAVILGSEFVSSKFILGYLILFTAHLSVHYSNDYFDFEVDHLTTPNAISGGSGVLVKNPELKEFSKWFGLTLMGISISLALIFTVIFNYPVTFFLFLLFGNLLAWFYTAPPIKLVYRRLGEVANIIAVVIFLGAGYFALNGNLDLPFFIFALPVILLQIIFINCFEIPSMEGDKLGNKITWIVLRGREFAYRLNVICAFLAMVSFLLIPLTGLFPSNLDFRLLAVISLIAIIMGIVTLIKKPLDEVSATKFATVNVFALFLMSFLIDAYFVYVVW